MHMCGFAVKSFFISALGICWFNNGSSSDRKALLHMVDMLKKKKYTLKSFNTILISAVTF